MQKARLMKESIPNLFTLQSGDTSKPIAPSFLAIRPSGNLIFGNGNGASEYFPAIKKLGTVKGVYIGDRHQGKIPSAAAKYFKAPLCCSNEEAKVIKKKSVTIDEIVPFNQHKLYDDLEAIPTPGHTAGALSYLWHCGKNKVLFIGDTIVYVDGEWKIWVSKKNAPIMMDTMEMLNGLNFNYIAVGSFAVTGEPLIKLTKKAKNDMIQSVMLSLKAL